MVADRRVLRSLSWALVVLVIISAVVTLLLTSGVLLTPFDIPDFVDRLVAIRSDQERLLPIIMLGALATLGVYLVAAMLGMALRAWSVPGQARDVMTLLLVLGGVIGIGSQLLHIGIHDAARPFYCDCGYRAEEVIALDSALLVAESMFNWLAMGAVTLVGAGVATAARVVTVSGTWRLLSYLIVAGLLVAVALRFVAALVFIEAFDPFQVSDFIVAITSGVLVPIWAILLARGVSEPVTERMAGPMAGPMPAGGEPV
jgi:hypothetical protein